MHNHVRAMNIIEQVFGEAARAFDEAFKLIGGIAIQHAKIEEMLDYLLWQLECYEISVRRASSTKPASELQQLFRQNRKKIHGAHRVMSQRVDLINKCLAHPRIASRLAEITYKKFGEEWPTLSQQLLKASERRRDIIHSAVQWSQGQLVRTVGGVLDGQSNPLDLKRDEDFLSDLGKLNMDVAAFATDLGHFLPYAAEDKIVTIMTISGGKP